ncbi:MAG: hypothetical protein IJT56_01230, partial [Clostridia bacterium]|nr:hypothetical protein [Clostridia bacterium]
MNRKSLTALLLVLALSVSLLPTAALAESGENMSVALSAMEEMPTREIGNEIAEDHEPENETAEEEKAEDLSENTTEEAPAATYDWILLRFAFEPGAESGVICLADAEGNTLQPLADENGEPLYGSYLLPPGTYSYSVSNPADGSATPETPLTLTGIQEQVDVTVRLTPSEPETFRAPVVFCCDSIDDFSGLTVTGADGERVSPYADPDTGELWYQSYLLVPGSYRYTYHDAEGVFADLEE